MGQAKARGTFEQRKAAAIARNEALAAEKEAMRQERLAVALHEKRRIAALPDDHPTKYRAKQRNLHAAILAGMLAASVGG